MECSEDNRRLSTAAFLLVQNRLYTFGLWRVCFPPCLVRPGRRLPVQGLSLSEGSLGYLEEAVVFGLWRVCFPPCLVRPGRRLPVQGLSLSEGSLAEYE